jgi:hypothetical protein
MFNFGKVVAMATVREGSRSVLVGGRAGRRDEGGLGGPAGHRQRGAYRRKGAHRRRVPEGLGATHLVLAGAASTWCIRATAYGALERGYDLTLVKDAHTRKSMVLDSGATIEAARVVDELNIAMTWLSYPGRKNGTALAEEVRFAAPAAR